MAKQTETTSDVLLMADLCAASGAKRPQIESWCRLGILVPYRASEGVGSRRLFKGAIPILDATEARELIAAGFSSRQILRRFTVQRAALTSLPPAAAVIERFKQYISTIVELGALFGTPPDFDRWLQVQQRQLQRMERDYARDGDATERDARLLHRVTESASPETSLSGLLAE